MRKIYISPTANLVDIKLRDGILVGASQTGSQVDLGDDIVPTVGENPGGGNWEDGDLSRTNNGGNVWDNAW